MADVVHEAYLNFAYPEEAQPNDPVTVDFDFETGIELAVVVRDQGRGIAPEDVDRIFEPFFTRRDKGTGLGLFVSIGLARAWGGDIIVDSELGEGTRFRVLFPSPQKEPSKS